MAEDMGGLDDLMMGNVSEEASESDEKIQARIAAAVARLRKIKKDSKKSHGFDEALAKILRQLTPTQLDDVIFLIDHEIPSLTILAILSLVNDGAGKICYAEFEAQIKHKADFSNAGLPATQEERVSYWWDFYLCGGSCVPPRNTV